MPKLCGNKEYTEVQLQKIYDAYGEKYFYQATLPDGSPNTQTKAEYYGDRIDSDAEATFDNLRLDKRAMEVTRNTQIAAIAASESENVL